jgi:diguanylate cyclase (GGDEF)-like protein
MFFLVNKENRSLDGKLGIGPLSVEEVDKGWHTMAGPKFTLQNLMLSYEKFKKDPESKLNSAVKDISLPLTEDMGVLALTALEGMPFEINSDEARSRVNSEIQGLLNLNNFVTIPLKTRDRTLGIIVVDNIFSGTPITKDNLRILNMFADHAALAIENSRLYEKTVHLSRTDWLTGLWNTRYFNEKLDSALSKARIEEDHLGLLMIDIDNFKKYNDSLGHQKGDHAIKRVAHILNGSSRKTDFVCRYGGEEFCIIMTGIDKKDGEMIGERLRRKVEEIFKEDDSIPEELKLTVSLGLSTFPSDGDSKDDLIYKADKALYTAKHTGKNRTCVYDE